MVNRGWLTLPDLYPPGYSEDQGPDRKELPHVLTGHLPHLPESHLHRLWNAR